ncbi:hypothetical protein [Phycisphaera mikurensis]|uniref:DUF3106 domain-containing protein n=1 Tax=Phycisphaera mikurensis (strain NBRC 102666 / KCTC 22515 / FYK2301M01) TaxID=1142394 RepID=I0IE13_PHYMF|nr:hypothetical protein [Phycisphaera mikurensis]MBB6441308.1 hypothetical protein [Phycisphaera mikurensis]BAM03501.1 hypothetical protein PSMK_13420 [Phycisphaera mikurensis NBRC 102666]
MPDAQPPGRLSVSAHDVAGERRTKRLKSLAIVAAGSIVLAAGAAGARWLMPPPMPATLADAEALVASGRFQRLSSEQKRPYLDVIREQFGSLDPEQRRALRGSEAARAARGRERSERLAAFSVMTHAQRQAMGNPWAARPERPEGRGERGPSRDRLSDRMQNGNAQDMATIAEMVNQMREHRGS